MGEYSFGRPSRITVTTSPGNKGIVNIEREVNMSGPIHNKGVLILGGYIAEKFAQEFPLSLNAYICFEQNYGGIDGDSATGAELYALISSLSKIPLKQDIAVTGSMNQKGEIQVVGGITEKVEGFYSACKIKGLSGNQGVIIPKNNSRNLVLSDEVNEAIKNGEFKIYTVERIEEALEILMDMKFEEIKKVTSERLYEFSKMQRELK
jgi:predicted ATP-dependent protease